MENSVRERLTDEEANNMLDEILQEDKEEDDEDDDDDDDSKYCDAPCAKANSFAKKKFCECTRLAENCSRFSLRVMEAMRRLQQEEDGMLPTSSVEDIVDYIQANYSDDGDLYAQVRTALKQVCSQGFVMELLKDEYHLVGPNAISMNQSTCSNECKHCALSSPIKKPKRRRKSYDEQEDCVCETPGEVRAGKTRRTNASGRISSRQQEEGEAECACSVIVTDEDEDEDDECVCKDEARRRNASRRQRASEVQESGDKRINEEWQRSEAREGLRDSFRRGRNNEIVDNRGGEDEEVADNVEDIYREMQEQSGSKKREKELKEWIKRCHEECKRRAKRKAPNN